MESAPKPTSETKEVEKTEERSEETKKQDEKETIGLFKSYMQCFQNKNETSIKLSEKWQSLMKDRKFWDTQPVVKVSELNKKQTQGPLKTPEQHNISNENTKIPKGFYWKNYDLTKDEDIQVIYDLLYNNYVEDDGGTFRFNYSKRFLQWALMPPGYQKDLYFGLVHKVKDEDRLIGFISGIVLTSLIEDKEVKLSEINFLCVHNKYRGKSIASILIREVVRRSNLKGIFQGLYTSGTMLPTPFAQTRYWHRSLNPEKLIKV